MTEGFWNTVSAGTFIPEYVLVAHGPDRSPRRGDALILPDEPFRRGRAADYPSISARNVIVVQTKTGGMGMSLMGQALFSARLALAAGALSVRSILLCNRLDAALLPLLRPFPEVEVWVADPIDPTSCRPANVHKFV